MSDKKITFDLPKEGYAGKASVRDFTWNLDEPIDLGGTNTGPTPMESALAALGGCIAITLRMYAQRKEWDTGEINVELYSTENENREKEIHKKITFGNAANLSEDQIKRLNVISTKCPVSKLIQQATPVILD